MTSQNENANVDEALERFKRWKQIPDILIQRGKTLLAQPYKRVELTHNTSADDLLNDLTTYPHAFVLACVMDRQVKAERAWLIPYEVSVEVGTFEMSNLLKISLEHFTEIFNRRHLHRFNVDMANFFYAAIHKINKQYQNDASKMWSDNPRSASVVRRFLEFDGVGVKIATMAANILARDFKIPFRDKFCVDISPDVHVMRVFKRLGFINENASSDELIYCARELNPEYPGIFDVSAWEIGRYYCRPREADLRCNECYLDSYCPKLI